MIRLRTLGALDLRGADGDELRAVLAQPRRVALLAYLALATPRGTQRRDTVLSLFWPELDVDRARNALGQAVHFLRRSIDAAAVVSNGDGLAIDWANFWCDAAAFEEALDADRVGEALALYRGDLLEGFHIENASEFDRWLDGERARLAARYTKAVEALATEREEAGDFPGAGIHWRVLAGRDPYNSRLTLRLMRALKAAGDPAGAIMQARQHERLLREELAIAPDAEVVALVRQLQAEQPEQSPSRPTLKAAQSAGDRVRVADQPADQQSPPSAARPRRRTAALTVGLVAAGVVVAAAVFKGVPNVVPANSEPKAAQTTGARDGAPDEVFLREMYARGRTAERSRSEIGLATARDAYERAIARDSTFALGYAGLAEVYGMAGHYGFMPIRPALDSARVMARRAVAFDSTHAATRTALASALADAGRFEAAEHEFRRAIELDSIYAFAHERYSVLLIALGRGEDAVRESQLAAKFNPVGARGVVAMQRYAHWLVTGKRPYVELPVRDRRPFLKVEPGDAWPHARQAEELAQAGECEEARKDLARAQRLAPDNVRMRPEIGGVEWWCGERPRARALLDDMKRRPDARDNGLHIAKLHVLFGENDSAFVWLEHHRQWTVVELVILSAGHQLDALRSDPRYLRLQRRLGVRK